MKKKLQNLYTQFLSAFSTQCFQKRLWYRMPVLFVNTTLGRGVLCHQHTTMYPFAKVSKECWWGLPMSETQKNGHLLFI